MVGMLLCGTANTILMKIQNQTPGKNDDKFNHPFVQCAVMFIGEMMCLVVYGVKVFMNKRKEQKEGHTIMSPGTMKA